MKFSLNFSRELLSSNIWNLSLRFEITLLTCMFCLNDYDMYCTFSFSFLLCSSHKMRHIAQIKLRHFIIMDSILQASWCETVQSKDITDALKNESKAWQMLNLLSKKLKSKQLLGLFRLLIDRTIKHSQFHIKVSLLWLCQIVSVDWK